MRNTLISGIAVLAAFAAGPTLSAPPGSSPLNPATQVICLDVGGQMRPSICRGSSSRLDQRYDICTCENAQRVEAPVCGKGERPLPEKRAYELARKDAARDGTLVGDRFEGRRLCVRARNG